jgi:hypothetical protein
MKRMLSNSLTPGFSPVSRITPVKASGGISRFFSLRSSAPTAPALSSRKRYAETEGLSERRSSTPRRGSLSASLRPAGARATAGDRVTMIARFICWLTIGTYLAVLSVRIFSLYTG